MSGSDLLHYFSTHARAVVNNGVDYAAEIMSARVEPEHLLWALAGQPDCTAAAVFAILNTDLHRLRKHIREHLDNTGPASDGNHLEFSERTVKLFKTTWGEARSLGLQTIGTAELASAILREQNLTIARIRSDFDLDYLAFRDALLRHLALDAPLAPAEPPLPDKLLPGATLDVHQLLHMAQDRARHYRCATVEPEHILFAVSRMALTPAADHLKGQGIDLIRLGNYFEEHFKVNIGDRAEPTGFCERTARAISKAAAQARLDSRERYDSRDLIKAILADPEFLHGEMYHGEAPVPASRNPQLSSSLFEVWRRAESLAFVLGHVVVQELHFLIALLTDRHSAGLELARLPGVDPVRLLGELALELANLPVAEPVDSPPPCAALLEARDCAGLNLGQTHSGEVTSRMLLTALISNEEGFTYNLFKRLRILKAVRRVFIQPEPGDHHEAFN